VQENPFVLRVNISSSSWARSALSPLTLWPQFR